MNGNKIQSPQEGGTKMARRPVDIAVRLPESKKYMKKKLEDIADRNGIPMNTLMLLIIEDFLKRRTKTIEL
jgi:phage terminase small subunit